jgi:hypothetical protein
MAQFWLYSHNFTHTGAPLVLAAIARELASEGWRQQLQLLSWGGLHDRVHTQLRRELETEGLRCRVLDADQLPPTPRPGDRLLLNSLALPAPVVETALGWLEQGQLRRLDWYAHEANPAHYLTGNHWPQRLRPLLAAGRLQLRVPSQHCLAHYQVWLQHKGDGLAVQCPRLELSGPRAQLFEQPLPGFDSLRLQLTGMAGGGHKGHLWLLRLVQTVLKLRQEGPLRPLELHFIGLETDPGAPLARELRFWGQALLGDKFHWTPHGPQAPALAAMARANIAVSCSRRETFSLVALEAMALGQPLLRNRTGGWQEQLEPAITGFDLGEPGGELRSEQVQLLQRLRDPQATPEAQLKAMGREARGRAHRFSQVRYSPWLLA